MDNRLCVGVSRQDITPKVGCHLFGYNPDYISEYVLDNLTLTTFAFSFGEKKAIMTTISVCSIGTEIADELRREISEKTNIEYQNILISCTHTHTGPPLDTIPGWGGIDTEYYEEILKPKLMLSCDEAVKSMQPVTVGRATGKSDIGINRRQVNIDNYVQLGQNPWGPYNPEMTVISFKTEKGDILGSIVHYGLHGTCAGGARCISRDWSGIMTDALEKESGGYAAFFNGPEGDVGPRLSNGRTTGAGNVEYIKEIGDIAAKDAVAIFNSINEFAEVSFDVRADEVKLPLLPRIEREQAEYILSILDPNSVNSVKLTHQHFKDVVESYQNDYVEQKHRKIPQTVVKIGDVVFVSTPYELFSEIGMRIDRETKDCKVLTLALTNGSEGYFPTQDQLSRHSYESRCFKVSNIQQYVEDADYHFILETLRNIKELN